MIFSNNVPLLDANFISPKSDFSINVGEKKVEIGGGSESIASKVSSVISSWYNTLRYISIVGLLIVLVYVGIRILLSTATDKKAKYKQMLTDWLVALILVIGMHYIMAFIMGATEKITNSIGQSTMQYYATDSGNYAEKDLLENFYKAQAKDIKTDDGKLTIVDDAISIPASFGYLVVFGLLVVFTLLFVYQYLRRVLYMAFLTVISPLVCLTYPIDKMRDGTAQGYNMWFKEYLFNALIQPFHLIIYVILFGIASSLNNVLFTLVVLAFMIPAEKFLRKMFGFDKASTFGSFAGAAAGSIFANAMSKIGKEPPSSKGSSTSGSGANDNNRIRISKDNDVRNLSGFKNGNSGALPENTETNQDSNQQGDNEFSQENTNTSIGYSGSASAADAYANDTSGQDPELLAQKEELEEKLADGQLTKDELTEDQKRILGIEDQMPKQPEQPEQSETQQAANTYARIFSDEARKDPNRETQNINQNIPSEKRKIKNPSNSRRENARRMLMRGGKRFITDRNHGVRKLLRGAGKVMGGALGATAGLAVGLASGDPSKVIAGAAVGFTGGSSLRWKTSCRFNSRSCKWSSISKR